MKKQAWQFYVKGLIAIVLVFAVCFFALGALQRSSAEAIAQGIEQAKAAAVEAVTGGETRTLVEDADLVAGVTEIWTLGNGGYMMTTRAQGLEGPVVLNIALDADGSVTGISVVEANESPEYGQQALKEEYFANYLGCTDTEGVDGFSGATYTSDAIRQSVDSALLQYQVQNGMSYDGPRDLTDEEKLEAALIDRLGEDYEKAETELFSNEAQKVFVREVYVSDKGSGIVVEGEGHNGMIRILVHLDPDGVLRKIVPIVQNESLDHGAKVFDEKWLYFYEGYSDFTFVDMGTGAKVVDMYSGATQTSFKLLQMVMTATDQYKLMHPAEAEGDA